MEKMTIGKAATEAEIAKVSSWKKPSYTTSLLLADVTEGLLVLRARDGFQLSDEQIAERARNIVAGLLGNYEIRSLDAPVRAAA